MSAIGISRHLRRADFLMSAFGGKADIEIWVSRSAFDPKRTCDERVSVSQYRVPYVTMLIVL